MALFDAQRTLSVASAAFPTLAGGPILTPTRLAGTESLGGLFEYTLDLSTVEMPTLPVASALDLISLDALIGHEVTVSIGIEGRGHFIAGQPGDAGMGNIGSGTREITGIVTNARFLGAGDRTAAIQLTLRPWLWLTTRNQDSRHFMDMTVVEITDAVLSAQPFSVEKRLTEQYPKRDYQRQYWESDFDLLARLWQEWGLYFWFEHSDGKHRLVLCDSIGAHQPHGPAYEAIRYEAPGGKRIDEEHIDALIIEHGLTSGKISLTDYDYMRPRADLGVMYEDPRDTAFAHQEIYAWGDHAQPQAGPAGLPGTPNAPLQEGEFLARVRMQALRCAGLRGKGHGNLRGLEVARTFSLTGYPQKKANRDYLVVSSSLEIEEVGQAAGIGQQWRCRTHFEIQPDNEVFRSAQTLRKPHAKGPESATITGPAGHEIWTDAQGRVKAQFRWDREGSNDENSSCWLREATTWQGNRFGATHIARIGQDVAVHFINGDPDLPFIGARLANGFNEPGWQLPGKQAISGFISRELENGGGANQLAMVDTKGKLQAQLSSDHASSQLSLGYLTGVPRYAEPMEPRGEGAELRSDGPVAVRSAKGMLLTTEAQPGARSHATDIRETVGRLEAAHSLHDALARIAQQSGAQDEDGHQSDIVNTIEAQNGQIRGSGATGESPFPELNEPHLLIAGKAGVEIVTPATVHVAAQQVAVTAEGHVGIASGRSFFATVRDTVRIVAQRLGMSLVAAAGNIVIHALTESIRLHAQKQILLEGEDIVLRAKKLSIEVDGSSLQMDSAGIVNCTAGKFIAHAAVHGLPGPRDTPVNLTPRKICVECLLKAAKGGSALVPR